MARLRTLGFESGIPSTTRNYDGETNIVATGEGANAGGTVSYQSGVARNGGQALQCGPGASNYVQLDGPAFTANRGYYVRFYLRFDAAPSQDCIVWMWRLNGVDASDVVLNSSRQLVLRRKGGTIIGTSAALAVDTWYRVEASIGVPASGNGQVALLLDGAVVAFSLSADVGTDLTPATHRVGHQTAAETNTTIYIDDLAINDANGSDNNNFPGPGNVTLLKPTGDNATGTGWEGPQTTGSDTTNLYDNVDNVPPTGVAHSDVDANAGKYIFNAANLGAASEYRASCQSMSDAGIPSGSVVTLSQAYMRASCDSTTGTNNMELQGITPSDGAVTANVETTAVAGTEPTGWKSFRTAYTNAPSLTYTTNPVVEATKILTGSTRAHMVDQMGLLIEWRPPVERSAAISATTAVTAAPQRDVLRSAAIGATGAITAAGVKAAGHERSAALAATGAIESAGVSETPATTYERSASLSATSGIDSQATFFSYVERQAALTAAPDVAASPQRELLRSAALSGSAGLAVAGSISYLLERSTAFDATSAVTTAHVRELLRQAALSGSADLTAIGSVGHLFERAAALSATSAVATAFVRELLRQAALAAQAALSATGSTEATRERSAALAATTAITVAGHRVLLRQASLDAAGAITSAAIRFSILARSAALAAGADLQSEATRDLLRSVSLSASTGISTERTVELARAALLAAISTIVTEGHWIVAHPLKDVVMTLSSAGAALSLASETALAVELTTEGTMSLDADRVEIETETATETEVTYG